MNKKQESAIRSMRKAGKPIKEIAKTLHVSDKRVSKFLKTTKASNAIVVPTKKIVKKDECKKCHKSIEPIDIVWKNGRIVKANRTPAELLVFGHAVITFALGEIVSQISK